MRRTCGVAGLAIALSVLSAAARSPAVEKSPDKSGAPPPAAKPPADTGITQEPGGDVTEKEIKAIPFDDYGVDNGFVTPVAKDLSHLDKDARKRLDEWAAKLDDWRPGKEGSAGQRVRNLLTVASIADIAHSEFEGEIAYLVFERLRKAFSKDQLIQAAAWVALRPKEGECIKSAPDLGFENELSEEMLRERTSAYAVKLLGRVLGKLPVKEEK